MSNSVSIEIIRYTILAHEQAQFEKAYADAGTYLNHSPYCLGYEVIHGVENSDHYIVLITWTSVDDHLNGFRKSSDFPPFLALVKPFINSIQEMKHYEQIGVGLRKES